MTLPAGVPAAVIERPFGAAGWRRAALAALAGAIATLGLAPYHIVPAAFIAFPMLVLAIDGLARRGEGLAAAFRLGWWFGFGYFIGGLWWLGAAMLVDAGLACLARGGITAFTIDNICREANASRGLVTHHFGSKDGLLAACYSQMYDRLTAALQPRLMAGTPMPTLRLAHFGDASGVRGAALLARRIQTGDLPWTP